MKTKQNETITDDLHPIRGDMREAKRAINRGVNNAGVHDISALDDIEIAMEYLKRARRAYRIYINTGE